MSFDVCLQGKRLNLHPNTENAFKGNRGSKSDAVLKIANINPTTDTGSLKKKMDKGMLDANVEPVYACVANFNWENVVIVIGLLCFFYTQFLSEVGMPLSNTHLSSFILFFIILFLPIECRVRASTHAALCIGTALTGSVFDTYHVTLPVVCVLFVQCFNVLYVHRLQTCTVEYVIFVLALFTTTLCFVAAYTLLPVAYAAFLEFSGLGILICVILYITSRRHN